MSLFTEARYTCYECDSSTVACRNNGNNEHYCLKAQGWSKSKAGRHWRCIRHQFTEDFQRGMIEADWERCHCYHRPPRHGLWYSETGESSPPPPPTGTGSSSLSPPPPPQSLTPPPCATHEIFQLLFKHLQKPRDELEQRVGYKTRLELFGSVVAGLNDHGSDLDVICFYENFADVDRQRKEMCLHMAFSFLSHHILDTCSGVRLQWNKSTICFMFRGVPIDLNVSWVKKELHSYVEISLYLQACVSRKSVDEWKLILESARQTGIAQQRGGARGSHLKPVVVSLLLAAAVLPLWKDATEMMRGMGF